MKSHGIRAMRLVAQCLFVIVVFAFLPSIQVLDSPNPTRSWAAANPADFFEFSRRLRLEFGPTRAFGQPVPTPDANTTHPDIIKAVNDLGGDPGAIFDFVRNLGFDAYSGSLRGAVGTLWSKSGNALDKSSLLVALLRAAGFSARYVKAR